MYRCFIGEIDYDDKYGWNPDLEKHFESIEAAEKWCSEQSKDRLKYSLSKVYDKDNKPVDLKLYFLNRDYGLERLKENTIRQLNDMINNVKDCENINDLLKLMDYNFYIARGLEPIGG